jgi:ATP-dependent helicase HrpA
LEISPEKVVVEEMGGAPVLAYPGIEAVGESVNLRLYKKSEEAAAASVSGVRKLVELGLSRDLVDLSKELLNAARKMQAPKREARTLASPFQQLGMVGVATPGVCTPEAFQAAALRRLVEHAFDWTPLHPLELRRFEVFLEKGRRALPGLAYELAGQTRQILMQKEALLSFPKRYKGMEMDVERLVPGNLPEHTPFARLQHIPRYLKAIQIRAERAVLNPAKDAEKAAQLSQFQDWRKRVAPERRETFRWLLEEFRVSLFAQELGTAESVSATKLSTFMEH